MDWYVFIIVGLALIVLSLVITIVKMEKFIRDYGDRLRGDENIRKLVDVDDAVLALYQK